MDKYYLCLVFISSNVIFINSLKCSDTKFKCKSGGECIYSSLRCDSFDDCSDGSDEKGCVKPFFINYPAMRSEDADLWFQEGQNVTLECQASGYPIPAISWKHQNNSVKQHSDLHILSWSKNGFGVLIIFNIKIEYAGSWICVAQNSMGEVYAPRRTIIHVKPHDGTNSSLKLVQSSPISLRRLVVSPEYLEIEEGRTATFICSTNILSAKQEWMKENGSLPEHAEMNEFQLRIPNVGGREIGRYICHIRDSSGGIYEKIGELRIKKYFPSSLGVLIKPGRPIYIFTMLFTIFLLKFFKIL